MCVSFYYIYKGHERRVLVRGSLEGFFPSLITFLLLNLVFIKIIYLSYTPKWLFLHANGSLFLLF